MSEALSTQITQLQADVATLQQDVSTANTTISTFSSDLAAALANAQGQGATPEQLQALTDLHTSISGVNASLESTLQANPLPASDTNPTPPVGGDTPPAA